MSRARLASALAATALFAGCDPDQQLPTPPSDNVVRAAKLAVSGFGLASLSAGSASTCGIARGGEAYCWGSNAVGRLGDGTLNPRIVPVAVVGGYTFTSISAGGSHSCGVTRGGQALCWGANRFGRLGDGTTTSSKVPVPVAGGNVFASVSVGPREPNVLADGGPHTCGVTTDGRALCWGDNDVGQLGTGNTAPSLTPAVVAGGYFLVSVSAGSDHTCGVTKDGAAVCWGGNDLGQLGNGTTTGSATPGAVSGGYSFVSVTAAPKHTCGLTKSGQALCWGRGATTPSAVPGGYVFTSVSAGAEHACGVVKGGQVFCWGQNEYGQLGDGTTSFRSTPVAVAGGFHAQVVRSGVDHTCAVTATMGAWCWGRNTNRQLGTGQESTVLAAPWPVSAPGRGGSWTYPQQSWGAEPTGMNAAGMVVDTYDILYVASFGVLEVGIPGAQGFAMTFTGPTEVLDYLPAIGQPGPLVGDIADPLSTASGALGGEVLALRLNVDFSEPTFAPSSFSSAAAPTGGASVTPFGSYTLCNFSTMPQLNNLTVRQFLGLVNRLLGGGSGPYGIDQLYPVTEELNRSLAYEVPTAWAHDHLVIGACA